MEISEQEPAQARDTVEELLKRLGLNAYLFAVEPRADHREVRVECAPNGSWRSSVFSVEEEWLAACRTDRTARCRYQRRTRPVSRCTKSEAG